MHSDSRRRFLRLLPPLVALLPLGSWFGFAGAAEISCAVFGDYLGATANTQRVCDLVTAHAPDLIVTAGDNSATGGTSGWDTNVGQFYHDYIYYPPGHPSAYALQGSATQRFHPALGNHDWDSGVADWYSYFSLPGNERYYTFAAGPIQFFTVDSDSREPDGNTSASVQAQWLQAALAASTSPWRIVVFHHPPYSSGSVHGNTPELQWPFDAWGASAVISGHDHVYERILKSDFPYFLAGTGGQSLYGFRSPPESGSVVRYNSDYGALFIDASDTTLTFRYYSATGGGAGTLIDTYTISQEPQSEVFAESFDTFPVGARVGTHAEWFDGDDGPLVGASNGVAGSQGLEPATNIFTWTAHPFDWNDAEFTHAVFGMDFQASAGGSEPFFNDDRVGWMTTATDVNSDYFFFGAQLDPVTDPNTGLQIEAYWRNASEERIAVSMADLAGITAGAWYRLRLEVTRLGATDARLDATLYSLDAGGQPGAVVASGSIPSTAAIEPATDRPNTRYFTAPEAYPAYKNYDPTPGASDNAYAEIGATGGPSGELVGHWAFEEAAGTVAHDGSGYGNDGEIIDATWTSGRYGGGLHFNGTSSRVRVPDSPSLSSMSGAMTVAAWVYLDAVTGDWLPVFHRLNAAGIWLDWQFYARASDASHPYAPSFRVDRNSDPVVDPNEEVAGDIVLEPGRWYFLAGTFDGSALRLYIDGTLRGTTPTTSAPVPNGHREIWIGGYASWAEFLPGVIDEPRIYSRALSGPEILDIMNPGLQQRVLTVNVSGSGSVTREPDQPQYDDGAAVVLTAHPGPGCVFQGWAGDLSGSANPETITMTDDMEVYAVFAPDGSRILWNAYNDCVYDAATNYIGANVTTFGIGAGFSGATSGPLLNQATGLPIGVTATLTENGGVNWQPSASSGGHDPNAGTDAYLTFGGVADMAGVIYYADSAGWYVDLTITGLDPEKTYEFATSACRAGTTSDYDDRTTIFTLSGAATAVNASTPGTEAYLGDPLSICFNTGKNEVEGYVARWTEIDPGADGGFAIRARHHPNANSGYKAYAFSTFRLRELGAPLTQHLLTVNVCGSGSVSREPDQPYYDDGATVTLTAHPGPGCVFESWAGDLSGSDNPDTITMTDDMDVYAVFAPAAGRILWNAYNDCVYDAATNYIGANVTTFGIGAGFSGATSGPLLEQATGLSTGVTATLTENGGVNWQPSATTGGHDPDPGTDAYLTFGTIADMAGVIYYASSAGWYVDLTLTGLDPSKRYAFATSACRAGTTSDYDDRTTIFSLSGATSAVNASTPEAEVYQGNPMSVCFNTGKNDVEGYVARWSEIAPGADGSFAVRAQHHPNANSGYKAYAFSVFELQELTAAEPQYSLTVNVIGQGSVTKDPDRTLYAHDEVVELTAVPADGNEFVGWSGDLQGSENPKQIVMTGPKSVTAEFRPTTSADDAPLPQRYMLAAGRPNPSQDAVILRYAAPRPGRVTLRIYDLAGREIASIRDETASAGWHEAVWNAAGVPSGVYLCRMTAPGAVFTRKIVVLR